VLPTGVLRDLTEWNNNYASINPQNFCPVFTSKPLAASLLLPCQSQSSMDLSSWMLKGSIPTSSLNSEMILFPQNTSTISQTSSGPSIPIVYSATLDASYVLNSGNLQLPVLQYLHNHPLASYFSQMTLHQVHMQYYWSGILVYFKNYC